MLYPMFSLILWWTVSWPPASFWKIYPFTEMVVRGVLWCDQGITFPCFSHMPYLTYLLVNMDASQVWNSLRSVYLLLPNDIVHQAHSSCHACTIKSEILFNYRILKKKRIQTNSWKHPSSLMGCTKVLVVQIPYILMKWSHMHSWKWK